MFFSDSVSSAEDAVSTHRRTRPARICAESRTQPRRGDAQAETHPSWRSR